MQTFDQPQRQSAVGIIIMAAHTAVRTLKAFFFLLILLISKSPEMYVLYVSVAFGGLVIISLIFGYLSYRRFTFFLDRDAAEFVVQQGIFNRDNLVIPLNKIQQVNITQDILQKIIGVYGLKIDTAGSKGEEVHIRAIAESAAISLKAHLLEAKTETTTAQDTKSESEPIVAISNRTLLKVGLTSHYERSLLLLFSFSYLVWHEGMQLADALKLDKDGIEQTARGFIGAFSVLLIIGLLLCALLIINLVRTFYKYFELKVNLQNGNLLLSAGFIAKKDTILKPKRVQLASFSQNFFQKKLNLTNLTLKQPQIGAQKKEGLQGVVLRLPGCNPDEKDAILKLILGKLPPTGKVLLPNWRFVNLPIFFKLIVPTIIFLILAFNNIDLQPYWYLGIVYLLIGCAMVYISYRNHQISVSNGFIVKQQGIWDVSQHILKPSNIQSISAFQYPWHKGIDVGHLNLHTAAGTLHFKYGNYSEIRLLVNYWLYLVERGEDDWG